MKMEKTEFSETSAYKIQTPGNYPEESIQGVAIKKPDSCSNPSLKKIRQSKCYPLQCSPLPDPYTAPCEFSTVGNNAAGHLVLCCSRVASLLLSLHPRTCTTIFNKCV